MGLVIFSGILIGTLFTLFVVPMFYTLIRSMRPKQASPRRRRLTESHRPADKASFNSEKFEEDQGGRL